MELSSRCQVLHDQLRGYYAIGTKSRKWWQYLFWFCVDVSIVNAFIVEKTTLNQWTRGQLEFCTELAHHLLGDFSSRTRTVASRQMEGGHWLYPFTRGCCQRYLKPKVTKFCSMGCKRCNKQICLACFPNHIGAI